MNKPDATFVAFQKCQSAGRQQLTWTELLLAIADVLLTQQYCLRLATHSIGSAAYARGYYLCADFSQIFGNWVMPTRNAQQLLSRAPAGRHACQFHRDAESLSPAVALFAGTGLQRGDSVVI